MPIKFRCPSCRTKLSITSKKAGASVPCPKCQSMVTVPSPETLRRLDPKTSGSESAPTSASPPDSPVDDPFALDADNLDLLRSLSGEEQPPETKKSSPKGSSESAPPATRKSTPRPESTPFEKPPSASHRLVRDDEQDEIDEVLESLAEDADSQTRPDDPFDNEDLDLKSLSSGDQADDFEPPFKAPTTIPSVAAQSERFFDEKMEDILPQPQASKPMRPLRARKTSRHPQHSDSLEESEDFTVRRPKTDFEELDLTPMVDVTFLLLIFFMITASFSLQKSMEIPAPDPDKEGLSQTPQTLDDLEDTSIIVEIDARNIVIVEDEPLRDIRDLVPRLEDLIRNEQKNEIVVTPDSAALHETVVTVLDAANEAGMQRIRLASKTGDDS